MKVGYLGVLRLMLLGGLLLVGWPTLAQESSQNSAQAPSRLPSNTLDEVGRLQREVQAIKSMLGLQGEVNADINSLLAKHPEIHIAVDFVQDRLVMRGSAQDVRQLRKLIDAGELWPTDRLEFLYSRAESRAATAAQKLKQLKCDCKPVPGVESSYACDDCKSLRSELREQVKAAFNLRLQLQQALLREAESKLEATRKQLADRVENANQIITQRMTAILDNEASLGSLAGTGNPMLDEPRPEVETRPERSPVWLQQCLEAQIETADKLDEAKLAVSELRKAIRAIDSDTNQAKLKESSESLAKLRLQLSFLNSQERQLKKLSESEEAKKLAEFNKTGKSADPYEPNRLQELLSRKVQSIVADNPSLSYESVDKALETIVDRKKFLGEREKVLLKMVEESREVKLKLEHLYGELDIAQDEVKRLSNLKARLDLSLLGVEE